MDIPRVMSFSPSPSQHHSPLQNRRPQDKPDSPQYLSSNTEPRTSSASVNAALSNLLQVDNDAVTSALSSSCTTPGDAPFRDSSMELFAFPGKLQMSKSSFSDRFIRKPPAVDVDAATNESANSIPTPTSDTSQQAASERKHSTALSGPLSRPSSSPSLIHKAGDTGFGDYSALSELHESQSRSVPGMCLKRKRMSPEEERIYNGTELTSPHNPYQRVLLPDSHRRPRPPSRAASSGKAVVLGHWRGSPASDGEEKHAVIGFIDVRDRLRTRIQTVSKTGKDLSYKYPMPTGPGSSWVTFDKICFSDKLVGLDHFQIKEYVRIKSTGLNEAEAEDSETDAQVVNDAIQRGRQFSMLESSGKPLMAYGAEVPLPEKPRDSKRRRTSQSLPESSEADELPIVHGRTLQPLDPLNGTRPTKIPLGYWKGSSEEDFANKHAVVGILGQNNMFRVKVLRETRDGHYVDGNFPSGAGALWIHYDEVQLEPHLQNLTRPEVKEYCRVRQYQLDRGEQWEDRAEHEAQAVEDARTRTSHGLWQPAYRVTSLSDSETSNRIQSRGFVSTVNMRNGTPKTSYLSKPEIGSADDETGQNKDASLPEDSRPRIPSLPLPRIVHSRTNTAHKSDMETSVTQDYRTKSPSTQVDLTKLYGGVRYERKPNGPFSGKLVSRGNIINIDGEDYVEYRVLTKPTFF